MFIPISTFILSIIVVILFLALFYIAGKTDQRLDNKKHNNKNQA